MSDSKVIEIEYRAGIAFIGTQPRFVWKCPGCGEDCHRTINQHPDSPLMKKLQEKIREDPRCTICMWRAGDAEADQVIKLEGFEDDEAEAR